MIRGVKFATRDSCMSFYDSNILKLKNQDVPYHCELHWLSKGKVSQRFFELCQVVDMLMVKQAKPEGLSDDHWF